MANLLIQLNQRVLTTAEILYYFPDYPDLLQQYVWQDYDQAPQFPCLKKFLRFWQGNLDGRLHSIRVTNTAAITSGDVMLRPSEIVV
jgi:uncharacterized protein Usg